MNQKKLIIIYGPTTSGKTSLAISLAKDLKTEIISADSRQVYKGLDIVSGKYSTADNIKRAHQYWTINGIRVNQLDLMEPNEIYSVSDFIKNTNRELLRIYKKNDVAIIAGGTGLYISALVSPIETINIRPDYKLRKKLLGYSLDELRKELGDINPEKLALLNNSDINNPRRLIRAIEISQSSAVKIAAKEISGNPEIYFIYLKPDKNFLRERIKNWYKEKLSMGLIEEVISLNQKYPPSDIKHLGLVNRMVTKYINKAISKEGLDFHLPIAIFRFAKQQLLWLNDKPEINYYSYDLKNQKKVFSSIITMVLHWYNRHNENHS